jgi:hypothetical protein
MLISTALLLDSNIRNSVMYSGKIAVPPGGGGIVELLESVLTYLVVKKIVYKARWRSPL